MIQVASHLRLLCVQATSLHIYTSYDTGNFSPHLLFVKVFSLHIFTSCVYKSLHATSSPLICRGPFTSYLHLSCVQGTSLHFFTSRLCRPLHFTSSPLVATGPFTPDLHLLWLQVPSLYISCPLFRSEYSLSHSCPLFRSQYSLPAVTLTQLPSCIHFFPPLPSLTPEES